MSKVSVVMPVYNTNEAYFREAIESILNQTFKDLELVIVDDCSQEYIRDIVLSYTDSRIKYYRLDKNQGAANARNFAISKANGKYVAFLDSDDISFHNRIETQYNFLEQNIEIGCLGTRAEILDSVNNSKMEFPKNTKHKDIVNFLIFHGCALCQSTVMLRKEILDKNNIFYKSEYIPAEDYAFWLDLIGYTKFEIIEDVLVKYRFYPENISNKQNEKQRKNATIVQINAIEKYCGLKFNDKEILYSFFGEKQFPIEDIQHLYEKLKEIITFMRHNNFSEKDIFSIFGRKYKKLYYKTHGLSKQWQLFKSPLNQLFHLSFAWRIFCFITRGVF